MYRRVVVVGLLAFLFGGCAQTIAHLGPLTASGFVKPTSQSPVLLMPSDIELSELTVGGTLEPKAEWTDAAQNNVYDALNTFIANRNARTMHYTVPDPDSKQAHEDQQLLKLHDVVGGAIIIHKYLGQFQLPTKQGVFDWSLGPSAVDLHRRHEADYALFIIFRDSYASPGRIALIVGAALLRVHVAGGVQVGIASLVDLRTGQVVWFNRLVQSAGDLRKPEGAQQAITLLLEGLPL